MKLDNVDTNKTRKIYMAVRVFLIATNFLVKKKVAGCGDCRHVPIIPAFQKTEAQGFQVQV